MQGCCADYSNYYRKIIDFLLSVISIVKKEQCMNKYGFVAVAASDKDIITVDQDNNVVIVQDGI
jgi:hypothetical protein